MARTADITVSVSLAIILNSAEKNEKAEKIRYARIVTAPVLYWLHWAFPIPVNYFINGNN